MNCFITVQHAARIRHFHTYQFVKPLTFLKLPSLAWCVEEAGYDEIHILIFGSGMLAPCAVRDGEQIEHFYWTEWTFIFLIMKNRMQLRCKRFVSEQSCTLKISIDFLCRRNEWIFYHPWHVLYENNVHMTSPARICQLTVCLFFPPHFLPQHCSFVSSLFPWITLTTSYLVTVFLLSQTKT